MSDLNPHAQGRSEESNPEPSTPPEGASTRESLPGIEPPAGISTESEADWENDDAPEAQQKERLPLQTDSALLHDLTQKLSRTESGIAFIYDALDEIVKHWGLRDVIAVIDEPPAGRQLFRVGHKAVTEHWAPEYVETAHVGLYPVPDNIPAEMTTQLINLCALALRIELLRHDAAHDPLTGLLNRRSFERWLDQAVSRSERYGWPFALVLLDLNDFKLVNDTYGHQVGDQVIAAIGNELKSQLRAGDVASRLGGDEFAIILNEGNPAAVPSLLHRLVDAPFRAGLDVAVGFSYGVALAPYDALEAHKLYLMADQRLYDAKAEKNERAARGDGN